MESNQTHSEYLDLLPTLKKHLEYYACRDPMLFPPVPYEYNKLDLLAELDALQNKTYKSLFNVYESVSLAINRLNDAHTLFTIPCHNLFSCLLLYRFIIGAVTTGG